MAQRRTWIKLYVDQTLRGTCFMELDPAERFIWFGFLLLAGDSPWPGVIAVTKDLGYTDEQLADLLKTNAGLIKIAKRKMIKFEKIVVDKGNKISIINWRKYQSDYERQKPHRHPGFFALRESIKERDGYTCQNCNKPEGELKIPLCIHHIDNDPKNNTEENLITLCMTCHSALLKKAVHKTREKERLEQAKQFRRTVQEQSSAEKEIKKEIEIKNRDIERELKNNIYTVFSFWKETLNHPDAKASDERKAKIKVRLEDFTAEQLKQAILGCKNSSWHMGENPDGKIYDSISLIFRNAEKVEYFIDLYKNPTGRKRSRLIEAKECSAKIKGKCSAEAMKVYELERCDVCERAKKAGARRVPMAPKD